mgnify:CR=1 FL=1
MKKIPSLFKRDYDGNRQVYNEVVPESAWVLAGEGIATLKLDGTSVLVENGQLYKRHELKKGKVAPKGFKPAQEPDPVTGDTPGWLQVNLVKPEDRWHVEAWHATRDGVDLPDGTYELMGPKVQGNTLLLDKHVFIKHGQTILSDAPRTFEGIRDYLSSHEIEGIVWHHPDGCMVKIKRRDFGFDWPPKYRKG